MTPRNDASLVSALPSRLELLKDGVRTPSQVQLFHSSDGTEARANARSPFFSEEALTLLAAGEREARRLGHGEIETRHLLLAIGVTEKPSVARMALAQLNVDDSALRAGVVQSTEASLGERRVCADDALSYTLPAKRALEHAMSEAHLAGRHPVDSGYLLLGMLHQQEDPAAIVLSAVGVTLDGLRRVLLTTPSVSREI